MAFLVIAKVAGSRDVHGTSECSVGKGVINDCKGTELMKLDGASVMERRTLVNVVECSIGGSVE